MHVHVIVWEAQLWPGFVWSCTKNAFTFFNCYKTGEEEEKQGKKKKEEVTLLEERKRPYMA